MVSWSTKPKAKSALRQGVVFFRLCPREVTYFCFSFCNSFSCEARNYLGQPMEIDARRSIGQSIFQQVSHASQQCISVPRCLFLYGRNAVEATKSLAPRLLGVYGLASSSSSFRICTPPLDAVELLVLHLYPLLLILLLHFVQPTKPSQHCVLPSWVEPRFFLQSAASSSQTHQLCFCALSAF